MADDEPGWVKRIAHFLPLAALPAEESDRHYREVHTPFARRLLREAEQVVSYHTAKVTAELDLAGGWRQRPRAFRFIVMRFLPGRSLELPEDVHERIVQDHRSCLRELRSFAVSEQVLVDRLRGQTSLVKYVLELDRRADTSPADADRHLAERLAGLAEQVDRAFGLRQVLVDRVEGEAATEAVDEPGQRPLGRQLPDTRRHAFVEFYADHPEWAEEWFALPAVDRVLRDPWWERARCYRVAEECGLDRR